MILSWLLLAIIIVAALLSFFTVQTAQVAVITRFGKFLRVAEAGLNWKWPLIDRVAGRMSLRVNQISLTMETKTKDNVFVTIPISVQNRVRPEKVYDAFYKLSDPMQQIQASHRNREKPEPSHDGGVGGLMVSPFSPPSSAGNLSASAGNPTASASVATARYGPCSLLAAAPIGIPTIHRSRQRRRGSSRRRCGRFY